MGMQFQRPFNAVCGYILLFCAWPRPSMPCLWCLLGLDLVWHISGVCLA